MELADNVGNALYMARVTQAVASGGLEISVNTLRRRLVDGQFTFGQLSVIAELTQTSVADLLPAAYRVAA